MAVIVELLPKHSDIIKGIDLSGDPLKSNFQDFVSVLKTATENGLKLALHCGEVKNDDEIEVMLKFGMDRIGHGTFIDGTQLLNMNQV
jgi:adenosine deaminase